MANHSRHPAPPQTSPPVAASQQYNVHNALTSTGLYRSCAALVSFTGTVDLIFFEAVNFEFIVEKDRRFEQNDKKIFVSLSVAT